MRSAGSRPWLTGCLKCPTPPLHLVVTTGSATSAVRTPSHQVAFAAINLRRPYSAPPVNHKRLLVCRSSFHFNLFVGFFFLFSQQPTRRSNRSHPTHPRSQVWKRAPTTAWLWWSGTSHQTVRAQAGAPTPRCWPWLDGSRRPMGNLLWGAMLACRGRATSPSSKGSSAKETSEVFNVYMYRNFLLTNKRLWNHYECAAHMSTATTNYYWLYLWY